MKKLLLAFLFLCTAVTAVAQPRIIAHRGYWRTNGSAQNSLASFAKADSISAYGSEMDVWLTSDGKLVVNHDRIFRGIDMERSTLRKIRKIVLSNGERLPTLDAYLRKVKAHPNTRLILELKSLSDLRREDAAVAKIVRKIRKYGLADRTDYIAFSINACLAFRKESPEARVYYLEGDLAPHRVAPLGLAGIDYSKEVLRAHPEWVAEAHAQGLEVNVWTVDLEEDMRYFIRQGVDYITTNEPILLQRTITEESDRIEKE